MLPDLVDRAGEGARRHRATTTCRASEHDRLPERLRPAVHAEIGIVGRTKKTYDVYVGGSPARRSPRPSASAPTCRSTRSPPCCAPVLERYAPGGDDSFGDWPTASTRPSRPGSRRPSSAVAPGRRRPSVRAGRARQPPRRALARAVDRSLRDRPGRRRARRSRPAHGPRRAAARRGRRGRPRRPRRRRRARPRPAGRRADRRRQAAGPTGAPGADQRRCSSTWPGRPPASCG